MARSQKNVDIDNTEEVVIPTFEDVTDNDGYVLETTFLDTDNKTYKLYHHPCFRDTCTHGDIPRYKKTEVT